MDITRTCICAISAVLERTAAAIGGGGIGSGADREAVPWAKPKSSTRHHSNDESFRPGSS